MRLLLALTSAAVVISCAGFAHADPSGDDAGFLDGLNKAGITYQNRDSAIAAGKGVCQMLDDGKNGMDIVKQLRDANPGFSAHDAANFTMLAAAAYCPTQLNGGGGSNKS
ncbi:DUF732 domain-containing protein [Mycobacterium noviomagense]|uniref:DUF732 domain-containing protein n=1 Tax=Mycobacterium noviomagense TaxID=459858 RepID=A0A7I7PHY1_9MYCO|nr:DUF732 domain-containing protein [Mycobacterium noviomagense]ORB16807.1 hypothetical protein BST37_05815 [Mycobacterium noviomagense]BBY08155.1 hypothetical protein MNVI_34730 [Mycobacterium noviomagense]